MGLRRQFNFEFRVLEASLRLCCVVVVLICFLLFIKTDATPPEPEEPKFNAFTGTGRRLDGKPGRHSTGSIPVTTSTTSATTTSSAQRPTGTPPAAAQRLSGKLVFGGGTSNVAGAAAAKVCWNDNLFIIYLCLRWLFALIFSRDCIYKILSCWACGVVDVVWRVVEFLACHSSINWLWWLIAQCTVKSC